MARHSDDYERTNGTASSIPPDWDAVRAGFPLLQREIKGKRLIYFDNANTGQKPREVIEAMDAFYRRHNANVSRATHHLGAEATESYEDARCRLAQFINVPAPDLILCSGATFALNLVAYSWALPKLRTGDTILLSRMEHHANIVPWQLVAQRTGASLKVTEIHEDGTLDLDALFRSMTADVKMLTIPHVSNVLGTINPVVEICREARERGIVTVIDGSQATPHLKVDVSSLGCDFYAFTGHKMSGPTGTGGLWARSQHLQDMPPFIGGGDMIKEVRFDQTLFNDPPYKFEAGTPNIAGFVGLGAAVRYLEKLGMAHVAARESELLAHLTEEMLKIPDLHILGHAKEKAAIVSFTIDNVHAHDLAVLLDAQGIAVRSGHHCAHPLLAFYGKGSTCRASLAYYNTHDEIEAFASALRKARGVLV